MTRSADDSRPLNVLVLYGCYYTGTDTTREHLHAFAIHSRHRVFYAPATVNPGACGAPVPLDFDINLFDVVIIHYSARLVFPGFGLAPPFLEALTAFRGLKMVFIQDDYDLPAVASAMINRLGIKVAFMSVPPADRKQFFGTVTGDVEFVQVMTGYVADFADAGAMPDLPPPSQRPIAIGYRARELPYRYGDLTREKITIAQRMKTICAAKGIRHDIELSEDKRLYGSAWTRFLMQCRATLGTETGSNVIDPDGSLTAKINRALAADRSLTYEQVHARFLRDIDGTIHINQVSPRVFEAIALRTGLVLFTGTYSNVVEPGRHFIELKKDFSNVDEVLRQVHDDALLEAMTERAYRDVIESRRYGYARMVEAVDDAIARHAPARRPRNAVAAHLTLGWLQPVGNTFCPGFLYNAPVSADLLDPAPGSRWLRLCKYLWRWCPRSIRPTLRRVMSNLRACRSPAWWKKTLRAATLYVRRRRVRRLLHACVFRAPLRRTVGLPIVIEDVLHVEGAEKQSPPAAFRSVVTMGKEDPHITVGGNGYVCEGLMAIARRDAAVAREYLQSALAGVLDDQDGSSASRAA
jgi:hypothetical protein